MWFKKKKKESPVSKTFDIQDYIKSGDAYYYNMDRPYEQYDNIHKYYDDQYQRIMDRQQQYYRHNEMANANVKTKPDLYAAGYGAGYDDLPLAAPGNTEYMRGYKDGQGDRRLEDDGTSDVARFLMGVAE